MVESHIQNEVELRGKRIKVDVGVEELVKSINDFQFGKGNYIFDTKNSCVERQTEEDTWIQLKTYFPQILDVILGDVKAHSSYNITSKCSSNRSNIDNKYECDIYIKGDKKQSIIELNRIAREIKRYSCFD